MQCGPEWVASNLLEILDYAGLILQAPGVEETAERARNRRAVLWSWVVQLQGREGRVHRMETLMSLICTVSIREMCATREALALWGESGPAIETKLLPEAARAKLAACVGHGAFIQETVPLFNHESWVVRCPTPAVVSMLEACEWRENVIVSMLKVMIETSLHEPCTVMATKQCTEAAIARCHTQLLRIIQADEEASDKVPKEVARRLCSGIFAEVLRISAPH